MIAAPIWRVAVVGAGPAAMYVVEQLLEQDAIRVEIDVYERLPTPWGLVRNAVAPDHPEKKLVIDRLFAFLLGDERVQFIGATEIGHDIAHEELAGWYAAVVYAVGADSDTRLDIPGEHLMGSVAARDFIGWYSGHPDHSNLQFDLSCDRAVVVGAGNVALDVARILALPPGELARTDIADHALSALASSRLSEVVVLGRRGRSDSAFHNAELEELEHLPGVDVIIEDDDGPLLQTNAGFGLDRKLQTFARLARRTPAGHPRRIVLRFLASPVALQGPGRVEQMLVMHNRLDVAANGVSAARATGNISSLPCGLVLRAVGYRGRKLAGLPFDAGRGVIANSGGRINAEGSVLRGRYVVGWAKRGCRGMIGSNKKCARETVQALLDDLVSGGLRNPGLDRATTTKLVYERHPGIVSRDGWDAINRAERNAGRVQQRPRVKITATARLLDVAAGRSDCSKD